MDDILIVTPYNAQVSDLGNRLPGARVGTVDKFQGQEAPVVIYSLTTSSPEEAPRGMEFLYSLHRLNVATSRARAACILVGSPRLLEPECRSPRQMQLANALCRYLEMARVSELAARKTGQARGQQIGYDRVRFSNEEGTDEAEKTKDRLPGMWGPLRLVRREYQFTESGLDNVVLKNIEALVCDRCKTETPRLPRMNGLMRTIALALITKPYKLDGQDIRFLRKFLGLGSEAFAAILDVDRSHLSRVENGVTPVSATADRLVRLIAVGLGEGLEQKARDVIVKFTEIKRTRKLKMMVDASTRSFQYQAA